MLPLSERVRPLVGALDSRRLQLLQEQALSAQTRASHLILDITGVPLVDSQVALGLIKVLAATRLLGATTVLVGIRPEVAQAVVGLGLRFDNMVAYSSGGRRHNPYAALRGLRPPRPASLLR